VTLFPYTTLFRSLEKLSRKYNISIYQLKEIASHQGYGSNKMRILYNLEPNTYESLMPELRKLDCKMITQFHQGMPIHHYYNHFINGLSYSLLIP
jgi:hypothetical protein